MPEKPGPNGGKSGTFNGPFAATNFASQLRHNCTLLGGSTLTCSPFRRRLGG